MKYDEQIKILSKFRKNYLQYCQNNPRIQGAEDYFLGLVSDGDENTSQVELKRNINEYLPNIKYLFEQIGESAFVHYSPPALTGGISGRVDLLANLFELVKFGIPFQMVIDMIDRAIGAYKLRQDIHLRNQKNIFWWIGEVIRLPFIIIKFAGFDSIKVEFSIFGKFIKLLGALLAIAAAAVTIFELYEKILSHFFTNLP